jgi:hypothetical protein
MNRRDPRIRQTLDQFQTNVETVNLRVQASLYDFLQYYINPCLQSVSNCLDNTCEPCLGSRRARTRQRHMSRSTRPEHMFDFYNDLWDEEYGEDEEATEQTGLLSGWGAPELDRILAGSGASGSEQPRRHASMNYGSRGPPSAGLGHSRGRSGTIPKGGELNPNEVPASSMFGFLESLPWKIGRRGLRYKPSAANLQENPHRKASQGNSLDDIEGDADENDDDEAPPLKLHHRRGISAVIAGRGEASGSNGGPSRPRPTRHHSDQSQATPPPTRNGHGRKRSSTSVSQATHTSLSSRGDLFPSDDEADAVPLDDEFATALERRTTGSGGRRRSSAAEGENTSGSNSRSGSGVRSAHSKQSLAAMIGESQSRPEPVESADEEALEMEQGHGDAHDLTAEESAEPVREDESEVNDGKQRATSNPPPGMQADGTTAGHHNDGATTDDINEHGAQE